MLFGCSLPSKTFMPEFTGSTEKYDPYSGLLRGYQTVTKIGFDYVEASVGVISDLTPEQLDTLARMTKAGEFRLLYCNCFVPGRIPLCTAPAEEIHAFVDETMRRLDMLGVRSVIFGSGAARRCPEDMTKEQATEKIGEFLTYCNKVGTEYDIMTEIEPLNRNETNMLNTVAESAALVRALDLPYVRMIADLFHMAMEEEDPKTLLDNIDVITHLHVSEAPGRVYPGKLGGAYIRACADYLHAGKSDKDVTIECTFGDIASEAALALPFLKETFA